MDLKKLNTWPEMVAFENLEKCCASKVWVAEMLRRRPYSDRSELFQTAETIWTKLSENDWKEAFLAHPKIGDVQSLRKKFENTTGWAQSEQAGVKQAPEKLLVELSELNTKYEKKFGFIFIICATGKSAHEMLEAIKARIKNNLETELKNAAVEQLKITKIRLEKLL